MNISDMVRAAYERMADVCVDVDTAFGSVAIGDPDTGVFMQGDEADEFILRFEPCILEVARLIGTVKSWTWFYRTPQTKEDL